VFQEIGDTSTDLIKDRLRMSMYGLRMIKRTTTLRVTRGAGYKIRTIRIVGLRSLSDMAGQANFMQLVYAYKNRLLNMILTLSMILSYYVDTGS